MPRKTKKELEEQIKRLQAELKLASRRQPPKDDVDKIYFWLGKAVQKKRTERGINQDVLAKKINMTRTSLANIEAGNQRAPIHIWIRLAELLTYPFVDLITLSYSLEMDWVEAEITE